MVVMLVRKLKTHLARTRSRRQQTKPPSRISDLFAMFLLIAAVLLLLDKELPIRTTLVADRSFDPPLTFAHGWSAGYQEPGRHPRREGISVKEYFKAVAEALQQQQWPMNQPTDAEPPGS